MARYPNRLGYTDQRLSPSKDESDPTAKEVASPPQFRASMTVTLRQVLRKDEENQNPYDWVL